MSVGVGGARAAVVRSAAAIVCAIVAAFCLISSAISGCGADVFLPVPPIATVLPPDAGIVHAYVETTTFIPAGSVVSDSAALGVGVASVWYCDGALVRIDKETRAATTVTSDACAWDVAEVDGVTYWISGGYGAASGAIHALDANGEVQSVIDDAPHVIAFAVFGATISWIESPDSQMVVRSRALEGGATSILAQGAISNGRRIVADADGVFFLATSNGVATLFRSVAGAPATAIWSDPGGAAGSQRGPALDSTRIFFSTDDHVRALEKSGGDAVDLGIVLDEITPYSQGGLVVANDEVFVASNQATTSALFVVGGGHAPTPFLASAAAHAIALAVDPGSLYAIEAYGGQGAPGVVAFKF